MSTIYVFRVSLRQVLNEVVQSPVNITPGRIRSGHSLESTLGSIISLIWVLIGSKVKSQAWVQRYIIAGRKTFNAYPSYV